MATVPSQATDNPFGSNPFDASDNRHRIFATDKRRALERWEAFQADHLTKMPPESAPPESLVQWEVAFFAAHFDAQAEPWCRVSAGQGDEGVAIFSDILDKIAEHLIEHVTRTAQGRKRGKELICESRIALMQRRAYWKAETMRIAREVHEEAPQPQAQPRAKSNGEASEAPTPPKPEEAGKRPTGMAVQESSPNDRGSLPPELQDAFKKFGILTQVDIHQINAVCAENSRPDGDRSAVIDIFVQHIDLLGATLRRTGTFSWTNV